MAVLWWCLVQEIYERLPMSWPCILSMHTIFPRPQCRALRNGFERCNHLETALFGAKRAAPCRTEAPAWRQ